MVLHLNAVWAHGLGLHQRPAVFVKEFPGDMAGLHRQGRQPALARLVQDRLMQSRRQTVAFAVRPHIGHVELAFRFQGEKALTRNRQIKRVQR